MGNIHQCPLCLSEDTEIYYTEPVRDYYQCHSCHLVFVPYSFLLSAEQEKAIYDCHQNSPDDEAYRDFLRRLFEPMRVELEAGSHGLDFGAGPGPTLSVMFDEAGFNMVIYDHFYANQPGVFDTVYDFITATEVMEHLHAPGREFERLWRHLKPGGLLGIMTRCLPDRDDFAGWHYKNDPTHVCFYSPGTFNWLAGKWGAEVSYPADDVVLFRKANGSTR
ncbi:MAG: class I SAM-dependent methyltransferase [Pseudomonadota bacterium]|nr:class I SAM-dependent methyltransferase [Pseudomonadota bacterium]